MSDFTRTWEASDKEYDFFDATRTYGTFTSVRGGDMTISMISYNTAGVNGEVITKYMPGQITYAPIKLFCAMSNVVRDLTDWFDLAVEGNFDDLRRNCSLAQYKKGGPKGVPNQLMVWELINAVPIALPGFTYNSYQRITSTSFKIVIQAEEIKISYP